MMPHKKNKSNKKLRWLSLLALTSLLLGWFFLGGHRFLQDGIDQSVKNYLEYAFFQKTGWQLRIGSLQYQFPCSVRASDISLIDKEQPILTAQKTSMSISLKDLLRLRLSILDLECKDVELQGYLREYMPAFPKIDLQGTVETSFSSKRTMATMALMDTAHPDCTLTFLLESHLAEVRLLLENPKQGLLHRAFSLPVNYDHSLAVNTSWKNLLQGDFEWNFARDANFYGNLSGSFVYAKDTGLHLQKLLGNSGSLLIQGDVHIAPDLIVQSSPLHYELSSLKEFLPALQGSVAGELTVHGPLYSPAFTCTAQAPHVQFFQQQLQNFNGKASGTLSPQHELGMHVDTYFTKSSHPIEAHFDCTATPALSFSLDNFTVSAPKTTINSSLSGSYADSWTEGTMSVLSEDLSLFSSLCGHVLSGSGQIEARLSREKGQQVEFTAKLPQASCDGILFEGLACSGTVENLLEIPAGELKVHCRLAQGAYWQIEDFHAETAGAKDAKLIPWAISGKGLINKPFDFQVRGNWLPKKNALDLTIDALEGHIGQDDYSIDSPVQVYIAKEKWALSPFTCRVREASITGSGMSSDNNVHLSWTIKRLPIEVFPLLSHTPLHGTFSSKAEITGTVDHLVGTIGMHLSEFTIPDEAYASVPPMQADISLVLQEQAVHIDGLIEGAKEYEAAFRGEIPTSLSLIPPFVAAYTDLPVKGSFHAKGEIAPFLQLFVADTTNITGKTETDLSVTGTLSAPSLHGKVSVVEGSFESLTTGALLHNIRAVLSVDKQEVSLAEFAAEDGQGGIVSGQGSMLWQPLEHFPYALAFHIDKTNLLRLDSAKAMVSGDLQVEGNTHGCCIKGSIQADQGEVVLPEQTKAAQNTLDVVYINQQPGEHLQPEPPPKSFVFPVALDLLFKVPKTGIIKGKNLHSRWKGNVKVKGTIMNPQLNGELHIVDGEYMFNGKPFRMSEGVISFAGDMAKKTTLYIIAYRDIEQIKAEVIVKGPVKSPAISFRSNPPLPEKEILSWILFNKGIDNITAFQGAQLTESITTLSAGNGGSDVFSRLRKGLGIDSIDISKKNGSGNNEVSIKVGKYISRGVFVSVNKSITSETNRVGIEANLSPNLKVQAEVGDDAEGQMLLKWKHDY